jgi:hypothetical protein
MSFLLPKIFAFAALAFVAAALTRLLRPLTNYAENALFERFTTRRVVAMRQQPVQRPVRVRQTDITATMRREDRAAFKRAEALLAAGNVRQAAALFESIRFQRRAIDILESAGHIDDACAMLMRLNAPGRAGVLFERNKQFEKAAHCFTIANQHEAAGKAMLKLGPKDYNYYVTASNAFATAEKWDLVLEALAQVMATDKILEIALMRERTEFLANYMANPELATAVLAKMTDQQLQWFFSSLPITPRFVCLTRSWVKDTVRASLDREVLTYLHPKQ